MRPFFVPSHPPPPTLPFSTPVEERWRVKQVGARRAFRYGGKRFTHQTFDPASTQTLHRLVTLPRCVRGASKPCIRTVPRFGRHHDGIHLLFQVPFFFFSLFYIFFIFFISLFIYTYIFYYFLLLLLLLVLFCFVSGLFVVSL